MENLIQLYQMVQTHNGFKKFLAMNNSKNNKNDSNSGTLSDLFKKGIPKD